MNPDQENVRLPVRLRTAKHPGDAGACLQATGAPLRARTLLRISVPFRVFRG